MLKHDRKARKRGERVVKIEHYILKSHAFKALTPIRLGKNITCWVWRDIEHLMEYGVDQASLSDFGGAGER